MYSGDGDGGGGVPETGESRVSGASHPETPPPGLFGIVPGPGEVERAVAVVERNAIESPDSVSTLVDVAETECGWWLLAELVTAGSASNGGATEGDGDGGSATPVRGGSALAPRDRLVESLSAATGRAAEDVFETLHAALLPRLLVSGLAEHVDSAAAPPEYAVTVELRSEADPELVSAVLLLVAVAAELTDGSGSPSEAVAAGVRERDGDRGSVPEARGDAAVLDSIERFSDVTGRLRDSPRRASRTCERVPTGARR